MSETRVENSVVAPLLRPTRTVTAAARCAAVQQALAAEYDQATEAEVSTDPFLAALAEAELDDEPYTDEERAAVEAGWEEYQRGETISLEAFRRELFAEPDAATGAGA